MDGNLQDDDLVSILSWDEYTSYSDAFVTDDDDDDEVDMQHLTYIFERKEEQVDEMTMNQDQAKIIQQVSNVSPLSVQDLKLHTRLFPFKLYDMLEVVGDLEKGSATVSWTPDGNAFIIHNRDNFMKYVAPMFFNQSKFRSFVSFHICYVPSAPI
jgi:hypothetical protein